MDKTLAQVARGAFGDGEQQLDLQSIPGLVFTLHLPNRSHKWVVEGCDEGLFRAGKTVVGRMVKDALAGAKERPMRAEMWIEVLGVGEAQGVEDEEDVEELF